MKRFLTISIFAILFAFGISFHASAQSRAERKKARQMDRIERKAERQVKRRDELTASAQAAYGTGTLMQKPKFKNKNGQKIRKRDRHVKPAKGTQSNALPWILRRKHS
jgi:hypothetical protein